MTIINFTTLGYCVLVSISLALVVSRFPRRRPLLLAGNQAPRSHKSLRESLVHAGIAVFVRIIRRKQSKDIYNWTITPLDFTLLSPLCRSKSSPPLDGRVPTEGIDFERLIGSRLGWIILHSEYPGIPRLLRGPRSSLTGIF